MVTIHDARDYAAKLNTPVRPNTSLTPLAPFPAISLKVRESPSRASRCRGATIYSAIHLVRDAGHDPHIPDLALTSTTHL